MRQVIVVSIALAAVGGLVQSAFAEAMSCEQRHQKCLDSLPWDQPGAKCMRALAKCEYDARHNPDAITGAGPIVPGGGKPGKTPGKGGTKLTSQGNVTGNVKVNAGALAATRGPAATTSGGQAGGAPRAANTSPGATSGAKPEAVPPQLADRLRRLQR